MISYTDTNRLLLLAIGIAVLASTGATVFQLLLRIPDTPYELGASIGPFVQALVETGRYEVVGEGRSWVASKMPLQPVFYAGLWQLTGSTLAMTVIKNLFFFVLLVAFMVRFARAFGVHTLVLAVAVAVPFCLPVNAFVMMSLSSEESILYALVPMAIGLTIIAQRPRDMWLLGVMLAAIFLTKSSMVVFCAWLAALAALNLPKAGNGAECLVPVLALLVAMLGWGGFTYAQSGHFAFGSGASSNNGWNLYKGNNPRVSEVYPAGHLDTLSQDLRAQTPSFTDEWEQNAWYTEQALAYMRDNPGEVVSNGLLKLRVLFFRVADFEFNRNRLIKIVTHDAGMIVNRVVLWIALIASAVWLFRRQNGPPGQGGLWSDRRRYAGLVFLGAFGAFALPYLVGFLYIRHLVPLFVTSFMIAMLVAWPLPRSTA